MRKVSILLGRPTRPSHALPPSTREAATCVGERVWLWRRWRECGSAQGWTPSGGRHPSRKLAPTTLTNDESSSASKRPSPSVELFGIPSGGPSAPGRRWYFRAAAPVGCDHGTRCRPGSICCWPAAKLFATQIHYDNLIDYHMNDNKCTRSHPRTHARRHADERHGGERHGGGRRVGA